MKLKVSGEGQIVSGCSVYLCMGGWWKILFSDIIVIVLYIFLCFTEVFLWQGLEIGAYDGV